MNSNNNEMNVFLIVVTFVGAAAFALAVLVAAIVVVAAMFATILAFFAWNKEIYFWGEIITPQEAREFVGRGVVGAIVVPVVFAVFISILDQPVHPDTWGYLIIGGYSALSAGVEMLRAEQEAKSDRRAAELMAAYVPPPPQAQVPAAPSSQMPDRSRALSAPIVQPPPQVMGLSEPIVQPTAPTAFRYASWNDEEIRS